MYKKSFVCIDGDIYKDSDLFFYLPSPGVFETILVKDKKILLFEEHIRRLLASTRYIFKEPLFDPYIIKKVILKTLMKSKQKDLYLRVSIIKDREKAHLIIIARPFTPYPQTLYTNGVKVKIVPTRRSPCEVLNPGIKSQDFLPNILTKIEASFWEAEEGLMCSQNGYLIEGGRSNLFIVRDGVVKTPRPSHVLRGITRGVVIMLLSKENIMVLEDMITGYDFITADEAFLTYTSAGIVPVVEIDGRRIGQGVPGPITKKILKLYNDFLFRGNNR